MPLTPEEQMKLKHAGEQFQKAVADVGKSVREGAHAVTNTAISRARTWLNDIDSFLADKKSDKKPSGDAK